MSSFPPPPSQPAAATGSNNQPHPVAFCWSPTDTDLLLLCTTPPTTTTKATTTTATSEKTPTTDDGSITDASTAPVVVVDVRSVTVSDGLGCNEYEENALTRIVQSHDVYHLEREQEENERGDLAAARTPFSARRRRALRRLSKQYRSALRDCLAEWDTKDAKKRQASRREDSMEHDGDNDDDNDNNDNDDDDDDEDHLNLFYLKATYDFMHLSDIFMPLLSDYDSNDIGNAAGSTSAGNVVSMMSLSMLDLYERPGIVTADFVRYLRFNHLPDVDAVYPDYEEMVASVYPEQFGINSGSGSGSGSGGMLFWSVVQTLVLRGCLDQAWLVLSRHSSYVEACSALEQENDFGRGGVQDPYLVRQLEDIRNEFRALRYLLLRAPIPGGRNGDHDDALAFPGWDPADDAAAGNGPTDDVDDIDDMDYQLGDLDVNSSDYKHWDDESNAYGAGSGAGIMLMVADNSPAIRKHSLWRDYVREQRRAGFALSRRFPQIDTILAILSGDFVPATAATATGTPSSLFSPSSSPRTTIQFQSWQEQFCAELLYVRPELKPRDFAERIKRILRQPNYQDVLEDANMKNKIDVVLNIMNGNAGQAIEIMWNLGGKSSAALPSTLTTLLYNLFIESDIIPRTEAILARKTDFLCDSAAAIISSLALSSPGSGIGPTLAIRLLLPYAKEGDRVIVATIAGILDRHIPSSDAEAHTLLELCHPLLEMKSAHILDGCCSIVLCRYRDYTSPTTTDGSDDVTAEPAPRSKREAMEWLVYGVELESLILPLTSPEVGVCYQALTVECYKTASDLLKMELDDIPKVPAALLVATTMLDGLRNIRNMETRIPYRIDAVDVLFAVHGVVTEMDLANRAKHVIACLEERTDHVSGARYTTAPWCMHWLLLRVGHKLLLEEQDQSTSLGSGEATPTSAFGKKGITVLMNRLLYVEEFYEPPADEVRAMREVLGLGLAHAYIAENALRKYDPTSVSAIAQRQQQEIASIRTCDLHKYPVSTREKVIQQMLDY